MFYIMTTRGWRPLHKLHYQVAESWLEKGWDVEEKVAKLNQSTYWVSEYNFSYREVKTRLVYSARQRAKKSGIPFSIRESDFEIPKTCPLRHLPFKVGRSQHTDDSPTLDRKDPRLGYVKGNVWVISHKANRLKGSFTPNELKTFCENALALDWVTWTSDDEDALRDALQRQQAARKRQMNEAQKPRWWALWGCPESEVK
jgi:hypothetical protein